MASPLQDLQGGIISNWNNAALVDSYIDDVHIKVYDSVGTGCYPMPRPNQDRQQLHLVIHREHHVWWGGRKRQSGRALGHRDPQ